MAVKPRHSRESGNPATRDGQENKAGSPRARGRRWARGLAGHDVRAAGLRRRRVKARHRLIIDDFGGRNTKAVELGAHGRAIGAEHANLDIIADLDVAGQLERSRHAVEIVAGRPVEAELHWADARFLLAQQPNRIAPAEVGGIEEGAICAVVDVELVSTALFDAD